MKPILSFDLDGTLMNSDYADHVWLDGLPTLYAKEKNLPISKAKKELLTAYDEIGDDKPEWYDLNYWFKKYQLNTPWQELLNKYSPYISTYPEVPTIIHKLSKHYTLIITSNAKQEFIDIQLNHSNLRPYFTQIFSSLTHFNQVKKQPIVYQKICSELNIKPQNLIHVGDHYEYDYISPQKIGITAYYLDRKQKTATNQSTVADLTDFYQKIIKNKREG